MDSVSAVLGIGSKIIDRFWPDAEEADKRKAKFAMMAQSGELKELEIGVSAILAEAKSADKWTSRARPSFLYLFYLVIVFLVVIFPMIGIWFPSEMIRFYENVSAGFNAIPEPMWWTFSAGYLGYVGARGYDKKNILSAKKN